jgi:hypothetical protein
LISIRAGGLRQAFHRLDTAKIWNRSGRLAFEATGYSARDAGGYEMPQELEQTTTKQPVGPLAAIPSLGFVTRRNSARSDAWRETVTQHVPEAWPAARLALQARIAALDIEA